MGTAPSTLLLALVVVANYYATTFSLWFGHWFSHLKGSPLGPFHVSGHHAFYPDSQRMYSPAFRYGKGRSSSIFALLPWLLLQTLLGFLVLSGGFFVVCLVETVLVVAALNYLHTQFHVLRSPLEQFEWFRDARRVHEHHHDMDVNFMVADHLWDRVFGTYCG